MGQAVLAWLKSNVITVICVVLVLILPPAGLVAASFLNTSIRTQAEEEVEQLDRQLTEAGSIQYSVPSISPEDPGWSERGVPNEVLIERVAELTAERRREIEEVVTAAVLFNTRGPEAVDGDASAGEGRTLLVEGLFPAVEDARERSRLIGVLLDRIDMGGSEASVYEALLSSIGAGGPPEPSALAARLSRARSLELSRLEGLQLDAEETAQRREALERQLLAQRLAEVQRRANQISVYATVGALADPPLEAGPRGVRGPVASRDVDGSISEVPVFGLDAEAPRGIDAAFLWQWDYWVISDVVSAIGRANLGPDGERLDVPQAAVKALVSLRVFKPEAGAALGGGGAGRNFGRPGAAGGFGGGGGGEGDTLVSRSSAVTHTGLLSNAQTEAYDIRRVRLDVVASTAALPRVLAALEAQNFMTVVGTRLSAVDTAAYVASGVYFGDEPVVLAQIELETAWLRAWTRAAMPAGIRAALGVPAEAEN